MSVNKVILIGHVGKDPDVRQLESGVKVATFSLATTEKGYTLQNGTQVPDRTEWHNIVMWRGLAETAEKYVKKGNKLYIEGKIKSRTYEDQNKVNRTIVEIFADNMELLGEKPKQQAPPPPEPPAERPRQQYHQSTQQAAPQQHYQPQQQYQPQYQQESQFPPSVDDNGLPFAPLPY